ncbi:uncharacterized protein LOC131231768 [Magnolia sinica]|uniref:uncharacterized protein LOC131231768 n=1 Tax=Magnolia sinica TaxID=86752 RepID=UPI00265A9F04|nr:uncharacterized protein LOC131231768 [Magnolia sinica]
MYVNFCVFILFQAFPLISSISFLQEIIVEFERTLTFSATPPSFRKSLSVAESESTSRLGSLNFNNFQSQMSDISDRRDFRPWHAFRKSPTDIAKKRNLYVLIRPTSFHIHCFIKQNCIRNCSLN